MITVKITHDEDEIARLRFTKSESHGEMADYIVQLAVERLGPQHSVGLYTRSVYGHRVTKENVLSLVYWALAELTNEEMQLDQPTHTSDLARRVRGIMPAIQAWTSGLRNNRSSIWSRQSVEHGDDSGGQEVREEDRQ